MYFLYLNPEDFTVSQPLQLPRSLVSHVVTVPVQYCTRKSTVESQSSRFETAAVEHRTCTVQYSVQYCTVQYLYCTFRKDG